jgi:putative chitinase
MNIVSLIPDITVAIARRMLPYAPPANVERSLPLVLNALVPAKLADKPMILMALATIGAETGSFLPATEGLSHYNTSPGGHPFDLYDSRADLGNLGPPDGERFKGRGFIQLTGRSNYALHSAAIGLGHQLVDEPDLANDPAIAARLLASFLKHREEKIRAALAAHDLREARRLVNGGSNGLQAFEAAYNIGHTLVPDEVAVVPSDAINA